MYLWPVLQRDTEEIINIERRDNHAIQTDEEIACMSGEKFKTLIDFIVSEKFEKKPYFSDRRISNI